MISFFKYQDPFRFGMLLAVLVIIRLPALLSPYPLLIPELIWQLSSEKMAEGFLLYRDIWEGIEPLSGGAYFLIHSIFGKSQLTYQILSLILVFIQASIFNFILNINNLYPDRTFVPALLYIIFSSLFFDFYTLSPVLMGMTFLIIAMHFVFVQIRTTDRDENLFYTGVFTAIASLFYFPLFVFIILAIIAFLLFSPSSLRRYFVLALGFLFPYSIAAVYYFVRDGLHEFIYCLFYTFFVDAEFLVSGKLLFLTLSIPVLLFILSLVVISANSRYINYQYVTMRIFGAWLIIAIIVLYFSRTFTTFQIFICIPPLAFFSAHLFLLLKNKYVREIGFLALIAMILWINYGVLYEFAFKKNPVNYDKMIAHAPPQPFQDIKGKKVLVLGHEKSYYVNNKIATPYLNWDLSKRHFGDLNNMMNLSEIHKNLSRDLPEIIVDQEGLLPALFEKLPSIGNQFQKTQGNIYIKKQ